MAAVILILGALTQHAFALAIEKDHEADHTAKIARTAQARATELKQAVQETEAEKAAKDKQIQDQVAEIERLKVLRAQREQTKAVVAQMSGPAATSAPSGCGDNYFATYIYMHESGCRPAATNGIGCHGIGQACPASKIAHCGDDYACQNAWFSSYANKYGGWYGAYLFWLGHRWW